MGFQGTEASEYNHIQSEVQILEDDKQVWDPIFQDCKGGIEY